MKTKWLNKSECFLFCIYDKCKRLKNPPHLRRKHGNVTKNTIRVTNERVFSKVELCSFSFSFLKDNYDNHYCYKTSSLVCCHLFACFFKEATLNLSYSLHFIWRTYLCTYRETSHDEYHTRVRVRQMGDRHRSIHDSNSHSQRFENLWTVSLKKRTT